MAIPPSQRAFINPRTTCGGTGPLLVSTVGCPGAARGPAASLRAMGDARDEISEDDFVAAMERIVAGSEKKSSLLNDDERERVAHHEMGHALVAASLPGTDPVHKVSIIPRSIGALGYTLQRPTEDRFLMSRGELRDKMTVLLGGRAAESIFFDDVSTGAADDLAKATTALQEDPDPAKLRETILRIGTFDGVQKPLAFDAHGDVTREYFFVVVQDGRFVVKE